MEDLVLSVPLQDAAFVETLALRMGWTMRRRTRSVRQTFTRQSIATEHKTIEITPGVARLCGAKRWHLADDERDRLRYEHLMEKHK